LYNIFIKNHSRDVIIRKRTNRLENKLNIKLSIPNNHIINTVKPPYNGTTTRYQLIFRFQTSCFRFKRVVSVVVTLINYTGYTYVGIMTRDCYRDIYRRVKRRKSHRWSVIGRFYCVCPWRRDVQPTTLNFVYIIYYIII